MLELAHRQLPIIEEAQIVEAQQWYQETYGINILQSDPVTIDVLVNYHLHGASEAIMGLIAGLQKEQSEPLRPSAKVVVPDVE